MCRDDNLANRCASGRYDKQHTIIAVQFSLIETHLIWQLNDVVALDQTLRTVWITTHTIALFTISSFQNLLTATEHVFT